MGEEGYSERSWLTWSLGRVFIRQRHGDRTILIGLGSSRSVGSELPDVLVELDAGDVQHLIEDLEAMRP